MVDARLLAFGGLPNLVLEGTARRSSMKSAPPPTWDSGAIETLGAGRMQVQVLPPHQIWGQRGQADARSVLLCRPMARRRGARTARRVCRWLTEAAEAQAAIRMFPRVGSVQ